MHVVRVFRAMERKRQCFETVGVHSCCKRKSVCKEILVIEFDVASLTKRLVVE